MVFAKKTGKHATMFVHYPDPSYISRPTDIRVVVRNTGDKKISYTETAIRNQFAIKITDEKGKEIPMTRYGKSRQKPAKILIGSGRHLNPGGEFSVDFDIHRLFDLTVPGDYKLSVGIEFGLHVPSATGGLEGLEFEVKDIPLRVRVAPPRVQDEGEK